MNKLSYCKLHYIQEIRNEEDLEYTIDVRCTFGNISSNKYYQTMNNGVELSLYMTLNEHLKDISNLEPNTLTPPFLGGEKTELRFITFKNVKYKVEKISDISANKIGLDLSELK